MVTNIENKISEKDRVLLPGDIKYTVHLIFMRVAEILKLASEADQEQTMDKARNRLHNCYFTANSDCPELF